MNCQTLLRPAPGSFTHTLACWAPPLGRLLLGGLFVLAGSLKLQDPQAFLFAIKGFKILPPHLAYTMAFVIPSVEIVAGTMLVLGLWSRAAALVLAALLVSFILGILNVLAHGYDTKCSCFGKVEWPCTGGVGWCQIIRNLAMMALALPIFLWDAGACSADRLLDRRRAPLGRTACATPAGPAARTE
ncbi:MAG: MauE/DoxX family redox-associated membrane protein [Phycisphaerales bacterium]